MGARFRDAVTGLFTSRANATAHPDTTVEESTDSTEALAKLRWRCGELEAAMRSAASQLRIAVRYRNVTDDKLTGVAGVLEERAAEVVPEETAW
jgi:hypothetical protein